MIITKKSVRKILPATPGDLVEKFEVYAMPESAPQNDMVDGLSQFDLNDEIGQSEKMKRGLPAFTPQRF
jgi:hypothetical protein